MANWGGKRPGQGRRTKAEELGLPKLLDEVFTDEEKKKVFSTLIKFAKEGSKQHAELLLAYYYGKPSEHVITENDTETIIRVVRDAGIENKPEQATPGTGADNQGG